MNGLVAFFATASVAGVFESSAHVLQRVPNEDNMKKVLASRGIEDLRADYDLSRLGGGVRGKYYRRATGGTNLVLIEPDLAKVFPDSDAVNRALRVLADAVTAVDTSRRGRGRQG